MFKIKYYYRVGDSFGSEDRVDTLEYEWEKIETVKEAMSRIREHYEWYESRDSLWEEEKPRPRWHNPKLAPEDQKWAKDLIPALINLPLDDGTEIQFYAPWCGYFESLIALELIADRIEISGEDRWQ